MSISDYGLISIHRKNLMLETLQTNNYKLTDYSNYNDNLLYLDYIKNTYEFQEIFIEPAKAHAYQGNLIGLFGELNIEPSLYLFTMYINNIDNPVLYDGTTTRLKLAIRPPIPSM